MKFYHGTKTVNVPSILKNGLKPDTTYGYSCIARDYEGAEAYAEWFHPDEDVTVLEITLDEKTAPLWPDMHRLVDEEADMIEDGKIQKGDLENATWRDSLRWIGQCVYQGTIPPSAMRSA